MSICEKFRRSSKNSEKVVEMPFEDSADLDIYDLGRLVDQGIRSGEYTEEDLRNQRLGRELTALRIWRNVNRGAIIDKGIKHGFFTPSDIKQLPEEYVNYQSFKIYQDARPPTAGDYFKLVGSEIVRAIPFLGAVIGSKLPQARETSLAETATQEATRFIANTLPFMVFAKGVGLIANPIVNRVVSKIGGAFGESVAQTIQPILSRSLNDALASAATVAHDLKAHGEDVDLKSLLLAGGIGGVLGGVLAADRVRLQKKLGAEKARQVEEAIQQTLHEEIQSLPDEQTFALLRDPEKVLLPDEDFFKLAREGKAEKAVAVEEAPPVEAMPAVTGARPAPTETKALVPSEEEAPTALQQFLENLRQEASRRAGRNLTFDELGELMAREATPAESAPATAPSRPEVARPTERVNKVAPKGESLSQEELSRPGTHFMIFNGQISAIGKERPPLPQQGKSALVYVAPDGSKQVIDMRGYKNSTALLGHYGKRIDAMLAGATPQKAPKAPMSEPQPAMVVSEPKPASSTYYMISNGAVTRLGKEPIPLPQQGKSALIQVAPDGSKRVIDMAGYANKQAIIDHYAKKIDALEANLQGERIKLAKQAPPATQPQPITEGNYYMVSNGAITPLGKSPVDLPPQGKSALIHVAPNGEKRVVGMRGYTNSNAVVEHYSKRIDMLEARRRQAGSTPQSPPSVEVEAQPPVTAEPVPQQVVQKPAPRAKARKVLSEPGMQVAPEKAPMISETPPVQGGIKITSQEFMDELTQASDAGRAPAQKFLERINRLIQKIESSAEPESAYDRIQAYQKAFMQRHIAIQKAEGESRRTALIASPLRQMDRVGKTLKNKYGFTDEDLEVLRLIPLRDPQYADQLSRAQTNVEQVLATRGGVGSKELVGKQQDVVLPKPIGEKKSVATLWKVVEADDLVTPLADDLRPSESYPHKLGKKDVEVIRKLTQMRESNFKPNLLGYYQEVGLGAPIVSADGKTVEVGAHDALALRRLYSRAEAGDKTAQELVKQYQEYLRKTLGPQAGITQDVSQIKRPVLVRQRLDVVDERSVAQLMRDAMTMSERTERISQALNDAQTLSKSDVELVDISPTGKITYAKKLAQKLGGEVDQSRVRNAIVAHVYHDPLSINQLLESQHAELKNVGKALVRFVKDELRLSEINKDYSLADDLVEVARDVYKGRVKGESLAKRLDQHTLTGDMSETGRVLLSVAETYGDDADAFYNVLADYAKRVMELQDAPKEALPNKIELLKNVVSSYKPKNLRPGKEVLDELLQRELKIQKAIDIADVYIEDVVMRRGEPVINSRALLNSLRSSGEMTEDEALSIASHIDSIISERTLDLPDAEKLVILRDLSTPPDLTVKATQLRKDIAERIPAEATKPPEKAPNRLLTVEERIKAIEDEVRSTIEDFYGSADPETLGQLRSRGETIESLVQETLRNNQEYQKLLQVKDRGVKGTIGDDDDIVLMSSAFFVPPPESFGKFFEMIRPRTTHEVEIPMVGGGTKKVKLQSDFLTDVAYRLRNSLIPRILKLVDLPYWRTLRKPELKPVYNSLLLIDETREEMAGLMRKAVSPFFKLPSESRIRVGHALYHGTLRDKVFTREELRSIYVMNDEEIRGYFAVRRAMDIVPRYATILAKKLNLMDDPAVQEVIASFSRPGYFPLSRLDRFAIAVKHGRETVYFATYKSPSLAEQVRGELLKRYNRPRYTVSPVIDLELASYAYKENLSLGSTLEVLRRSKRFTDTELEKISNIVGDYFRSQLAKGHLARRENIAGYTVDVDRTLDDYISAISNALPKKFLRGIIDAETQRISNPIDRKFADNLWRYFYGERNAPQEGPVIRIMRRIIYDWFLALKPAFGFVNMGQRVILSFPEAVKEVGIVKGLRNSLLAQKYELALWSDAIRYGSMERAIAKAPLPLDIRRSLMRLYRNGQLGERFFEDVVGGKLALADKMLGFFGWVSERSNRHHAGLLGLLVGYEKGLRGSKLLSFASSFIDRTQFIFGKVNRPEIARGVFSVPFIFWNFTLNYIHWLLSNMATPAGRKAVLMSLGAVGMLGGFLNVPPISWVHDIIENTVLSRFPKKRAEWEQIKQDLKDNPLIAITLDGLPSYINISGAPYAFPEILRTGSFGEAVFGASYSFGRSLWTLGSFLSEALADRIMGLSHKPIPWKEILERSTPSTVRNLLKALEEYPTDIYGRPVLTLQDILRMPKEIRPQMYRLYKKSKEIGAKSPPLATKVIRGLGFAPYSTMRQLEIIRGIKATQLSTKRFKADLNRNLALAIKNKDVDQIRELLHQAQRQGLLPNVDSIQMNLLGLMEQ